ncbi:MAG: hypothetical protein ABMB14_13260 [Myxococcota bacterium]
MSLETTWLKTTTLNRGQDHLGTRAVCEILYIQLLPGITNVTDRGRYYTLYPWLLWAMDREEVPPDERVAWFRRADCLLTLIALRHGAGEDHSRSAVGSEKLVKALRTAVESGGRITLSTWARTDEHTDRYFANQRGGLGQYYLGPLEALSVVGRGDGGLTWSTTYGRRFAEAVDAPVDRTRFVQCVSRDAVDLEDLDALRGLCLCGLDGAEREALSELMWADGARRNSLGLILALADQLPTGARLDLPTFRGATVSGVLPDGARWQLSTGLARARQRWEVYQRSEWLSVAIQGLFWATLKEAQRSEHELRSFAAFGDLAVERFGGQLGLDDARPFDEAVAQVCAGLPDPEEWTDEQHEHQRAHRIVRVPSPAEVARDAVHLLLAMVGRSPLAAGFAGVEVAPRQLEQYPVNLVTLHHRRAIWSGKPVREVLHDLVTTWGVRLHERVALRKLRYQMNDTFQVRRTEEGSLVVEGVPLPVFGSPRFDQAVRMLQDLGALDRRTRRPTALGARLLGGVDE